MYRQLTTALLMSIVFSGALAADGETAACGSIVDDARRLRCYDEAAGPTAAGASPGIWRQRIEKDAARETFTLTAFEPNYFTYSYSNSPNQEPYDFLGEDDELDKSEIKFQLSFRSKLADDLFGKQADLWFGYTQVSFWQLFNGDISAPFRETNYAPEVFLSMLTDYQLPGLNLGVINLGIVHQSNGRAEPLSRSWNRVYAEFILEQGDFALTFKPWARIEESASEDDNPDIIDYLGNYELRALYQREGHLFSVMLRNITDRDHRYNSELQWSFPIQNRLRGLLQWYNGYGENMIDHDHRNNRIAIGILMTDWL